MSVDVNKFGTLGEKFLNDTFASAAKTIDIQSLTRSNDGSGGFTETWTSFAAPKAFIIPQTGNESILNDRVNGVETVRFHLRPITGFNDQMKIVYDSADYQINYIKDLVKSGQWLIVIATKGVAI